MRRWLSGEKMKRRERLGEREGEEEEKEKKKKKKKIMGLEGAVDNWLFSEGVDQWRRMQREKW